MRLRRLAGTETGGVDIADIAVEIGLAPGEAVVAGLIDREVLAAQKLGLDPGFARRRGKQVEHGCRDRTRDALDEALRLHRAAQMRGGEVRPRGHQSSGELLRVQAQNRDSSTSRIARTPWDAPPLERPGLSAGVQP